MLFKISYKKYFLFFSITILVLFFQNCGSGFEGSENWETSSAPLNTSFFEQEISIMKNQESSCLQCHTDVNLWSYIKNDEISSLVSLYEDQMISFDTPQDSNIISLIRRRLENGDPAFDQMREQEELLIISWLQEVNNNEPLLLRVLEQSNTDKNPQEPQNPPQEPTQDNLERRIALLNNTIGPEIEMKCGRCHNIGTTFEFAASASNRWIVQNDSKATIQTILSKNLINFDSRLESLLYTKPKNITSHGGGAKFEGDNTYLEPLFIKFVENF